MSQAMKCPLVNILTFEIASSRVPHVDWAGFCDPTVIDHAELSLQFHARNCDLGRLVVIYLSFVSSIFLSVFFNRKTEETIPVIGIGCSLLFFLCSIRSHTKSSSIFAIFTPLSLSRRLFSIPSAIEHSHVVHFSIIPELLVEPFQPWFV